MGFATTAILGFIRSLTESFPVSPAGHLAIIRKLITIDEVQVLVLSTTFYLTASLALVFYFRFEIWTLIQALIRKLGRLPTNQNELTTFYALALSSVPGVIAVIFIQDFLLNLLSVDLLAIVIFCLAIFYMYTEWKYFLRPTREVLSAKKGFLIGLFQLFAFIPGSSRLGVTLAGGMLLGLNRLEATKFSFLLAIPLFLTMGFKNLFTLFSVDTTILWWSIIISAVINFITVFVATHCFLLLIRRYSLWPFIWYNLILTFLVVYLTFFVSA